ncbi:MAG: hypothetical protein C0624_00490 [Desulfuromonas sp.]|nr:MAG: hypothetical protein C0624_00490 [Desulfuromonas sp.]
MSECQLLETCIFFNDQMDAMPAVANLMKNRYCKGDFAACARLKVVKTVGREKVPTDMFPNQDDYAERTIAQG